MIPVHEEVYRDGVDQPLLFINSELGYQWQENIHNITRLLKPVNDQGRDMQNCKMKESHYCYNIFSPCTRSLEYSSLHFKVLLLVIWAEPLALVV